MTGRLSRTPQAIRDLAEIVAYIAAGNPRAAARVADRLDEKSRMLAEQPGIGRPYPGRHARLFPFGPYLILYRETSEGITVLRYYHGRRDPRRL